MICGMWLDVINDKQICSGKARIPCSVNIPAVFGLLLEHHLNVYETCYGNVARGKKTDEKIDVISRVRHAYQVHYGCAPGWGHWDRKPH